jgi:hypothetical protein
MRKPRKRQTFDPVADWDGLISTPVGLWTPAMMQENARRTLAAMERSSRAKKEDDAERGPPRRRARMEWWK